MKLLRASIISEESTTISWQGPNGINSFSSLKLYILLVSVCVCVPYLEFSDEPKLCSLGKKQWPIPLLFMMQDSVPVNFHKLAKELSL